MCRWSPKVEDVWRESGGGGGVVYKMKIIQFLGRYTPIVLENSNTPCLLTAICNVLLLRNELDLRLEMEEVSQEKLLTLLSKRILKSATITQNKGEQAVIESRYKMADAVGLLSHLSAGNYVTPCFKKIDDIENTAEHAIFSLLGISLYHGCMVDSKDSDTAEAIGFSLKSASDVFASSQAPDGNSETAVWAAASEFSVTEFCIKRGKVDMEEVEELRRVLNLSKIEISFPLNNPLFPEFVLSDLALGSVSSGSIIDSDFPLVMIEEEPNCKFTDSSLPIESVENAKSDTVKHESSQQTCAVDFSTLDICQMTDYDFEDKVLACYSDEEFEEAEGNSRSRSVFQDADAEEEWILVHNTQSETASQLANYGLRCLQDSLKDEELGILFQNNHFRTIFKYSGETLILVTDQGYRDDNDVWEKLRMMNGNAEFMNGDFKDVRAVKQDASSKKGSDFDIDLEMAMALQGMEYDGSEFYLDVMW